MKTQLYFLAALTLAAALSVGCDSVDGLVDDPLHDDVSGSGQSLPDTPELTVAATDFTMDSAPVGAMEIPIEVNVDWTVSVEYEDGVTPWLDAGPCQGPAGKVQLVVNADANPLESERIAHVCIGYGDLKQFLDIRQKGISGTPHEPLLELHTTHRYENFYGHETYEEIIAFKVNRDWKVAVEYDSADTDWLDVTPLGGTAGEHRLTMNIAKNPATDLRHAYIRISYGNDTEIVSVYQRGLDLAYIFEPELSRLLEERGYVRNAGSITPEEVKYIKSLQLHGNWNAAEQRYTGELTSLRGIEYFESLESLTCWGNKLTELDVSRNVALVELMCYSNQLTSLELGDIPNLRTVYCGENRLNELDVSRLTAAGLQLSCYDNQLTSLDVSNNSGMFLLNCSKNRLTSLDVSKNPRLEILDCGCNRLASLDVSDNPKLRTLSCAVNPGDGSVFSVSAWFDNRTIPRPVWFTSGSWSYEGNSVTVDYRKVK